MPRCHSDETTSSVWRTAELRFDRPELAGREPVHTAGQSDGDRRMQDHGPRIGRPGRPAAPTRRGRACRQASACTSPRHVIRAERTQEHRQNPPPCAYRAMLRGPPQLAQSGAQPHTPQSAHLIRPHAGHRELCGGGEGSSGGSSRRTLHGASSSPSQPRGPSRGTVTSPNPCGGRPPQGIVRRVHTPTDRPERRRCHR